MKTPKERDDMRITLSQLKSLDACKSQVDKFSELFGESVDVTPELCVSHAQDFDWGWAARNLLTDSALAEYERVTSTALAEYKRVTARAFGELGAGGAGAGGLFPSVSVSFSVSARMLC